MNLYRITNLRCRFHKSILKRRLSELYDVFQGRKSNCHNKLEIGTQLVKRLETTLRIKTNYCR